MSYHCTPSGWLFAHTHTHTHTEKITNIRGCGENETMQNFGRDVKGGSCFGKQSDSSSEGQRELPFDQAILLPGMHPREMKTCTWIFIAAYVASHWTHTEKKAFILTSVDRELQQQTFSHGNISSPAVSIGITKKWRKQKCNTALINVNFY